MQGTRDSILNLLCASLQRNVLDVEDLKDVAQMYRQKDIERLVRSSSLDLVVDGLRMGIFNADDLREAVRIGCSGGAGYGGGMHGSREEQNVNFKDGDWICEKCGNLNFARRTECHRGSCGAPRPQGGRSQGYGAPSRSGGRESRPGDWDCEKCGNLNFAYRTECHRNDCKAPKPSGGGGGSGTGMERTGSGAGGYGPARGGGDWNCEKCGTMNFARRSECFNNACKAPRGDDERSTGGSRYNPYDEPKTQPGDWVCEKCQMVNFAHRTVCHRNSCMEPRPEED